MTEVAQALRDKTAVVGTGLLIGSYPDRTALSLAVDAYQMALEEGPRPTANLAGCDLKDIRIGMPVEADYEDITGEITLINFRPVRGAR